MRVTRQKVYKNIEGRKIAQNNKLETAYRESSISWAHDAELLLARIIEEEKSNLQAVITRSSRTRAEKPSLLSPEDMTGWIWDETQAMNRSILSLESKAQEAFIALEAMITGLKGLGETEEFINKELQKIAYPEENQE